MSFATIAKCPGFDDVKGTDQDLENTSNTRVLCTPYGVVIVQMKISRQVHIL
jgi:hypothetical protein